MALHPAGGGAGAGGGRGGWEDPDVPTSGHQVSPGHQSGQRSNQRTRSHMTAWTPLAGALSDAGHQVRPQSPQL